MQTITLTVELQTKHTPGTPEHLLAVVTAELKAKGIVLEGTTIKI